MILLLSFTQGVLHWVAEPSPGVDPLKVEVRLFDKLFLSEVDNVSPSESNFSFPPHLLEVLEFSPIL